MAASEDLDDKLFEECKSEIDYLEMDAKTNIGWLLTEAEEFCKRQAMFMAISQCVSIYDNKDEKKQIGAIPQIMTDALSVSFETHVGHDFLEDYEKRFDFYHRAEEKLPFSLEKFNLITKGGVPKKSMTIFVAGTGVGKSLIMCNLAAHNMLTGKSVLYITLEMREEHIAERIDAHLLDIPLNDLVNLSKIEYHKRMESLKRRSRGKLLVKEYPGTTVGSAHFRALLQDLKIKKNFIPDVIYIDYLNICVSTRLKMNNRMSMYEYVKAVAEEIRALAVEFDVPIITACQFNREGNKSSDPGLENTAESFGIAFTADLIVAAVVPPELAEENKMMFCQLKNRHNDINFYNKFLVGVDRTRMKMYDVRDERLVKAGNTTETTERFVTPQMERDLETDPFKHFT